MERRPFELQMACSADLPTSFSRIKAFDGAILFIKFESQTRSHDYREASEAVCTRRHSACNCPGASQIGASAEDLRPQMVKSAPREHVFAS